MQRERQTQKALVTLFKSVFPCKIEVIKIDNEGRKEKARNAVSEGLRKGACDLLLVFPAEYYPNIVFFETKTQKLRKTKNGFSLDETKQSNAQEEFEQSITELGHFYKKCSSVEQGENFVLWWCKKNGLESRLVPAYRQRPFSCNVCGSPAIRLVNPVNELEVIELCDRHRDQLNNSLIKPNLTNVPRETLNSL